MNQLERLLAMTTKSVINVNEKLVLKDYNQEAVKEVSTFVSNRGLVPVFVNCVGLYQNDIQGFREIMGKSQKELAHYCVVLLDHDLRPPKFEINPNLLCLRINSPDYQE